MKRIRPWVARWLAMVVIWVALWGTITFANVIAGILVATGVLLAVPLEAGSGLAIRPIKLLHFAWFTGWMFAKATVVVAVRVLSPQASTKKAIIAIPIATASDGQLTVITNVIGLSPGSVVVEIRENPTILYLHVFHAKDPDEIRKEMSELEELTMAAFPVPHIERPKDVKGAES